MFGGWPLVKKINYGDSFDEACFVLHIKEI